MPRYRERHGWPCITNGRAIAASLVDEQVGAILTSVELESSWRARILELTTADDRGPSIEDLRAQRRRLGRAYTDGAFTDYEYKARLSEIDSRINAGLEVENPNLDEVAEILDNLDELGNEATPEEKTVLIAPLIERAYLDIRTKRIGAITPAPAFRALLSSALQRTDRSDIVLIGGTNVWRHGDGFSPVSTKNLRPSESEIWVRKGFLLALRARIH
jgi:hypothetical protein